MIVAANIICIYIMINNITGQMYIGQTNNFKRRINEHLIGKNAESQAIDRACLKYGREAFTCIPLEEFKKYDKGLLDEREKYWIARYDTFKNPDHYNLTHGGDWCGVGEDHPNWRDDLDDDVLVKEYLGDKLTLGEIARRHNTNHMTIRNRLNKFDIDTSRDSFGGRRDDLYDNVLVDEYLNNKLSCREIARRYNTGLTTVRRRLNNFGIDTSRDATKNKTGFYRVSKEKKSDCKQGFCYTYKYPDNNGKQKSIRSVDLKKLEIKVKEKGLTWRKL